MRFSRLTLSLVLAVAGFAGVHDVLAARPVPFHGFGSWIDIWDREVLVDVPGALQTMRAHGVRTVYIETSHFAVDGAIVAVSSLGEVIEKAHARDMTVVGWYLPGFADFGVDSARVRAALSYRSPSGERLDGFALDVESKELQDVALRTHRALALARTAAEFAGGRPVGAIVPVPQVIARRTDYWNDFPYKRLAALCDVLLPMVYYTKHARPTRRGAGAFTARAIASLRRHAGHLTAVHAIGGVAHSGTASELAGFGRAALRADVVGLSLFDFRGTTTVQWAGLSELHDKWQALGRKKGRSDG